MKISSSIGFVFALLAGQHVVHAAPAQEGMSREMSSMHPRLGVQLWSLPSVPAYSLFHLSLPSPLRAGLTLLLPPLSATETMNAALEGCGAGKWYCNEKPHRGCVPPKQGYDFCARYIREKKMPNIKVLDCAFCVNRNCDDFRCGAWWQIGM
jgi:hypothetical protein